jgi:pyruvate dehydrogenase E2 component (dihydrolipoamide acetyltransferase)
VADHASRPEPPADEAVVERPAPVAAVSEPRSVAGGRAGTDLRPAVVAALVRGWQTIPHVNIGGELDAQGLVTARAGARATPRVSYTDLLLLALARALGDVPDLAAVVDADGRATRVGRLDLSLAVATSRGVVAPRIVDVPALGLPGVARERERLVDAARGGRLDRRDLAPGCCTLSNLGSYPVDFFTPVLSGPGACMVATGRIAERVVARDGLIGVRPRIWANVCIDHRAADGEAGGRLLQALERRIQDLPRTI